MGAILTKGFIYFDGLKFVIDPGPSAAIGAPVQVSNYSASIGELVRVDPSAGGFTVTLPSAVNNINRVVIVKNVTESANAVTINTVAFQTIDGYSTQTINIADQSFTFISDSANWIIL